MATRAQEIPEILGSKDLEERTLMIPHSTWEAVTYHTDSGDGWSEVESTPIRKRQDIFRTQYSRRSYSSLTNKIQTTRLKPILKKPSSPKMISSSLDELIAGPIPHCQDWTRIKPLEVDRDFLTYRSRQLQQMSTLPKTDCTRQRTHPQNTVPAPVTKFLVKIIDSQNPLQEPYLQKAEQHTV